MMQAGGKEGEGEVIEEIKEGKIRMDHFPILHVWQNP